MEAWTQFFVRAGIPKEIAQKYAKSFQNNRITKEMLPELDKSTLTELGVTAIGDQLCILRRIKAAKIERADDDSEEVDMVSAKLTPKARITAPSSGLAGSSGVSEHRRGKPPPDRHEIYHVKMPEGSTHRTRQIMQKAEKMRQQGLAVRGTTGVRQGGRSVSPVDKNSLAARMYRKETSEVSSSTDRRHNGSKISRIATSGIKKTITNRPSLSSRMTTSGAPSGSHSLRIHVDPRGGKKMSRIEGRLQKATTNEMVILEEEMVEDVLEYEDDEMAYDEEDPEDLEYEEVDEVVTVPVRQRLSYAPAPGRLASTVQRAPPRPTSNNHSHHRNRHVIEMSPPSSSSRGRGGGGSSDVFSRLSFNNSRR